MRLKICIDVREAVRMTLHLEPCFRFVAYYRVSTARQGRSGLGLEAQREAVRTFLAGSGGGLADAFTEVESGKHAERPQLGLALDACRLTGAVLVIAKLDRLSRDAYFLLGTCQRQRHHIPSTPTPATDAWKAFISEATKSANARTLGLYLMVSCMRR
jgi:DNA invertase Pin-like site-specific DNA recombinase